MASFIAEHLAGLDWGALAAQAVHSTMRVAPGERVVTMGDAVAYAALHEAVSKEVLRAGGIVHAHVPAWRGAAADQRTPLGLHPSPEMREREVQALRDLLGTADVFLWLPHGFCPMAVTAGASEEVLDAWGGRGLHFHFFNDWHLPEDHPAQARLAQTLERAVLQLDYEQHRAVQDRLLAAVRGKALHVTTPDGTDVRVQLADDGWYHVNDGVVTIEKQKAATCARDREEELPAGTVRSIPVLGTASGTVRYRRPGRVFGTIGHDVTDLCDHLDLQIEGGRIVEVVAKNQAKWDSFWEQGHGAFEEITEVVFGTNPLLHDDPELVLPPYWGFGAGMFRLHTGSNAESGGDRLGGPSMELWLWDATVTADGVLVVQDGRLVV
jgi:hypothetical protein